jgi:UDP-N-acetylmuramyl pentapeptide phosphotransferase/UDP-N-acetylglucosamine-1-phosphate transferase
VTYCAIGGVIGGIGSAYAGRLNAAAVIEGVFVWIGVFVMLRHGWSKKPTWREMLRAKPFWLGAGLVAVGNIFWFAFSK